MSNGKNGKKMAKKKSKNESTATDIAPVKQATEAEAKAFDLDPHLISLMWAEPFFSKLLRRVTKEETTAIPTAGVTAREGQLRLYWNRRFMAGLTNLQVKGLLKHECYHLVFEHTTTRRHDPHVIWNYATDLAINSLIPEQELPEGGLIPGKPFRTLTQEQLAKMQPDAVERYYKISEKIQSLPKEKSAEWYFGQLQEIADEIKQQSQGSGGDGEGEGDGSGSPGTMDSHEGWDELTDEERELVRGKVKNALEEAVREADGSGQWGSVPAEVRNKLRELISSEIPWQSVLKQFCGHTRRANRDSNLKRLNRKYPGIHPGVERGYTSSIAVYIDQSGSVDDASLGLFFGELRQLARRVRITLFNFDTSVDLESEREWDRNKNPGITRTRAGGTDFDAPTKHANSNRHRFDSYIIMSDGECNAPGKSLLRRAYVICPGRKLMFDPPNRDIVIQMTGKKDE